VATALPVVEPRIQCHYFPDALDKLQVGRKINCYKKTKPNNSIEKILKKKNTRKKGKYKGSGIYQLTCKDFHKKMHLSTMESTSIFPTLLSGKYKNISKSALRLSTA